MRLRLLIMCTVLIIIFGFNLNLSGKYLIVEKRFGKDNLLLPGQILFSKNRIIVYDEVGGNDPGKIRIFSEEGKLLTSFGEKGEGPGFFFQAVSMVIKNGKIYILDDGKMVIHIFSEYPPNKLLGTKRISSEYQFNARHLQVFPDGSIYYLCVRDWKGEKNIWFYTEKEKNLYILKKRFLDCIPVFENLQEMQKASNMPRTPDYVRKSRINFGYLASSDNRIYFTSWLMNTVLEMSLEGNLLNKYTLPIKSIEETVGIITVRNRLTIERRLNYGIIYRNGRLYVLSRDENGDSIVFELLNGKFSEKCRVKEPLFNFDISGKKLYGITQEDDNVESEILIYRLDK